MTRAVWVVGESGLLGSRIRAVLEADGLTRTFRLPLRIRWDAGAELDQQMRRAVREFATAAAAAEFWAIYWAAGVGSFAATHEQLQPELLALRVMLEELDAVGLAARDGAIGFSSSAGALYAGSSEEAIGEASPVTPTTPYGFAKVEQEDLLRRFASEHARVNVFVARISTMYGPRGRDVAKGLLAHMARSVVLRKPLEVFVPFDTVRDYVHVDDVSNMMLAYTRQGAPMVGLKIIASERPASISEIIGIFRRASRRPLVVNRINRLTQLYDNRVSFRSVVELPIFLPAPTTLSVGVFQLLESERLALARGSE